MNAREIGPRKIKSLRRSYAETIAATLVFSTILTVGGVAVYDKLVGFSDPSKCDPNLGFAAVNQKGKVAVGAMYELGIRRVEVRVPNPKFKVGAESYAMQMRKAVGDPSLVVRVSDDSEYDQLGKHGELAKPDDSRNPIECEYVVIYDPEGKFVQR